jgi:hemin uptake protein HemP
MDSDLPPKIKQIQQNHVVGAQTWIGQRRTSSHALLGPGSELIIEHGGREYRLRLTQNGKLILTA